MIYAAAARPSTPRRSPRSPRCRSRRPTRRSARRVRSPSCGASDARPFENVSRTMDGWIDFYDSAHSIYVSPRHRDIHFRRIAEDLARYVTPGTTVIDYGCGEALHADIVANQAARLILIEPAPGVRARLAARFPQ